MFYLRYCRVYKMSLKLQKKNTETNKTKRANDLINCCYYYGIILWVHSRQNVALPRAAKCLEPGLCVHLMTCILQK